MDDQKILDLFFARNQMALTATQEKYGMQLLRFAKQILKSREDAEECVNDTYLKTWNTIPPQRPTYFQAFLMKICRFQCFDRLDYIKAAKRSAQMVELSAELEMCIPDNALEEALKEKELGRLLNTFVEQLPADKRILFVRRYWYMDSIADIASRFQLSESSVKVTLHRIRKRLAEYLKKEGVSV